MPVKVGLKRIELWGSRLEEEVCAYEREENRKGEIVFYGPSYFTRWSTKYGMVPLREEIVGESGAPCVINRGFGSSCSEHQLYYYHRMIKPLAPSVLVYSGQGNGSAFGYTIEEIWELAQRVVVYALTDFPDIRIYLCGTTPARDMDEADLQNRFKYDSWAKAFCEKTPNCIFLEMMHSEPLNRKDIFVEDGVHYNQTGYKLFGDYFRSALKEELKKF